MNRAFTLIEAIVYFALFSLFLVGGILAAYQILQGQGQAATLNTGEDEGGFVVRKIEWALNGATISYPNAATPFDSSLHVLSNGGIDIRMRLTSGVIEMSENGGVSYFPLTTNNVTVSSLSFHYLAPSGSGPEGIEASTTINGEEFDTVRYIR